DHQGRDRRDAEMRGELLLGLRVDLPEDRARVLLGHPLVDRSEHPARAAPGGPEINQDKVGVPTDHLVEVFLGQFHSRHRWPSLVEIASTVSSYPAPPAFPRSGDPSREVDAPFGELPSPW